MAVDQRHGHPGKSLAKLADHARHQRMKASRARIGDGDSTFLTSRCAPRGLQRAIEESERRTGAIKECSSRVGQLNAARDTTEQLNLGFLLDCLDKAAKRRLLNAEPFRRAGDVPFLGHGDKVAEMPELHFHTSRGMKFASLIS